MKTFKKSLWAAGIVALGCLLMAALPANTRAQLLDDSDHDGLTTTLEEEGILLMTGFELWDADNGYWITADLNGQIPIFGAANCQENQRCLSDGKPDLFIILRLANPDDDNIPQTNIDLQSCDIFALAIKPADRTGGLGFNVWVLREGPGYESLDRRFSDESGQKAIIVLESPSTLLTITGISDYGTIMDEGKGIATVYTQKIIDNIRVAAVTDQYVQSDSGLFSSSAPPYDAESLECLHFQNTTTHEILHVLWTLENYLSGVYSHHITKGEYIMNPAVVVTEKKGLVTYYIPEVASKTTQANWSFYGQPR